MTRAAPDAYAVIACAHVLGLAFPVFEPASVTKSPA
jgi:hypothetical protein